MRRTAPAPPRGCCTPPRTLVSGRGLARQLEAEAVRIIDQGRSLRGVNVLDALRIGGHVQSGRVDLFDVFSGLDVPDAVRIGGGHVYGGRVDELGLIRASTFELLHHSFHSRNDRHAEPWKVANLAGSVDVVRAVLKFVAIVLNTPIE